jgi:hypothetical protein
MKERIISVQTLTDDFQQVFLFGQNASDMVSLVQCEVRCMQNVAFGMVYNTKICFKIIMPQFPTDAAVKIPTSQNTIGSTSTFFSMSPLLSDSSTGLDNILVAPNMNELNTPIKSQAI